MFVTKGMAMSMEKFEDEEAFIKSDKSRLCFLSTLIVELCLICPSAIAFALGMAFSRTPKLTVCHWINNQYVPVFKIAEIEARLPFD